LRTNKEGENMFTLYDLKDSCRRMTDWELPYNVFDSICKGKSKRQRQTAWMVIFGKKKDRGNLKHKYLEEFRNRRKLQNIVQNKFFDLLLRA